MPVIAIILGVAACVWSWYGVIALHSFFWLIVFVLGALAILWGVRAIWWHGNYPRRGPPPTY